MAIGGIVLGLVASFLLTGLLREMLFGIEPTDPATFAEVTLFLLGVALAACSIPALRATRADALVVLRSE